MEPLPLRETSTDPRLQQGEAKKAPPRQILDFQKSICITILFSEDGAFAVTASIARSLETRAPNPPSSRVRLLSIIEVALIRHRRRRAKTAQGSTQASEDTRFAEGKSLGFSSSGLDFPSLRLGFSFLWLGFSFRRICKIFAPGSNSLRDWALAQKRLYLQLLPSATDSSLLQSKHCLDFLIDLSARPI
jgi:hypothetical protein